MHDHAQILCISRDRTFTAARDKKQVHPIKFTSFCMKSGQPHYSKQKGIGKTLRYGKAKVPKVACGLSWSTLCHSFLLLSMAKIKA